MDDKRTFTVATDAAVISMIESAKRRLVVIAPALSLAVATALAARFDPRDAATLLQAAQGDAARAALAQGIDDAVRLGVFGSPFVRIDGEPFFGADRLPQIEARLAGRLAPVPKE